MRRFVAALFALALAAPTAAHGSTSAAQPGRLPVPVLQPGKPARPTGPDAVTVYAVDGGSGLSVRLNLKVAGEGTLVLHAPDGTPMLEKRGMGNIDLDAVLSIDAVHFVSVLRSQAAQPAVLRLETTEPDLHLAMFSGGVGFVFVDKHAETNASYESRSCWIVPGVKLRMISPFGFEDMTLGRGGMESHTWRSTGGETGGSEKQLDFADDVIIYRTIGGSFEDVVVKYEEVTFAYNGERYGGYLCDEAAMDRQ